MDIKITCRSCDRTYPLSLAIDPEGRPGHCPFCGEVLAFQYTPVFLETADRTMSLGQEFQRQLTLLAELAGGFSIDEESVLRPVNDALSQQQPKIQEPYRKPWPPAQSEPVA